VRGIANEKHPAKVIALGDQQSGSRGDDRLEAEAIIARALGFVN
jgi:hypothetical protein